MWKQCDGDSADDSMARERGLFLRKTDKLVSFAKIIK